MIQEESSQEFMKKLPEQPAINFDVLFAEQANPLAVDLLKRMLVFDPDKRISVDQALKHPYLASLHSVIDEPTGEIVDDFDFDFELYSLTIPEYQELIYEEIKLYHSEEAIA